MTPQDAFLWRLVFGVILGIVVGWGIGLLPAVVIRYAGQNQPLSKKGANWLAGASAFISYAVCLEMNQGSFVPVSPFPFILIFFVARWISLKAKKDETGGYHKNRIAEISLNSGIKNLDDFSGNKSSTSNVHKKMGPSADPIVFLKILGFAPLSWIFVPSVLFVLVGTPVQAYRLSQEFSINGLGGLLLLDLLCATMALLSFWGMRKIARSEPPGFLPWE